MKIKVLGVGCAKCEKLKKNIEKALADLDIDADVEKVEEINEIIKYNVMLTPALVINEKLISSGKVLSVKEIKKIVEKLRIEN